MGTEKGERSPRIRSKALFGGPFGRNGKYAMASVSTVDRGLHGVKFMVLDPQAGQVLAIDTDKREALAAARRLLRALTETENVDDAGRPLQGVLWRNDELPIPAGAEPTPKRLTRRRLEVLERSGGHCFYCRTPLLPFGNWHVEHQLPRALGGNDTAPNLVAACPSCNLKKSDRTAIEFVTLDRRHE